jgi:hypothetical protein
LLVFAVPLLCQWLDRAPLQPYEVRSPSGAWTLGVEPSNPSGKGAMRARILHGDEVRWSGDFPWTFEQAGISDDGACVGYSNDSKLRIAVLDSAGVVRREHDMVHTAWVMHGPALPSASGSVLVHPAADLALIRVHPADQSRPAPWYGFRLSTGERAADVKPVEPLELGSEEGLYEREARAVGDTGLTLLHWLYADYAAPDLDWPRNGGVFALHDLAGKPVWSLALLDDYTDSTSEEAHDRLRREIEDTGAILSVAPDRFVLRHVREGAQVTYGLSAEADGWRVEELAREPWSPGRAPESVVEDLQLALLGSVRLGTDAPEHAIHDVLSLGFTEQGEIELMRREGAGGPSYARLRPDGELLFERDLSSVLPAPDAWPQFHELAGDRWLLQFTAGEPPWLAVDVRTGEAAAAPLPESGLGSHVAPLPDGGYLALLSRIVRSLAFSELYHVRADGTVAWTHTVTGVGPDDTDFDRAVYFADGLARTGDTTFALLASDDLTVCALDRRVLRRWSLAEALGHELGYVDGLLTDAQGGVLFEEDDAFQRIDAQGLPAGSFVPERPDGSRDPSMRHLLRVAPDGRLWTSDRHRVYRLDDGGVVDLVLGPEPRDDELVAAGESRIDALGRAVVQDAVTRAVHVFAPDGTRLALCRLEPAERPDGYVGEPFEVHPDGSVVVTARGGRVRFDATGTRTGTEPQRARRERGARAASGLMDAGLDLDAIAKRPDGRWLADVAARARLTDGRAVVLEGPGAGRPAAQLHFYGAAGEPLRTLALPPTRGRQLSASARWLVIGHYQPPWILVRLSDERVFRFDPVLAERDSWHVGQSPDGTEVRVLGNGRRLMRFALP